MIRYMNNLKDILLEKLKVTKNSAMSTYHYIDSLKPGSREKAEEILSVIKERYGDLFDDYRILRTNNVTLGKIKEIGSGMYDGNSFTIYLTDPNEYLIRRITYRFGGVYPSKFIEGFSTLEDTFNKFDEKLRKRGYLK